MSVYVDPLIDWGWKLGPSCHLMADTDQELHDFAAQLGLKRAWAQHLDHPRQFHHHYDLTKNKRAQAVKLGAIEIEWADELASIGSDNDT